MTATKAHLRKVAPLGGKARALKLSAARRSEIARMGGLAGGVGRGKKKKSNV